MSLEMYGKCGNERVSTEMYPPENWIGCYPNYARGYHEGSCHGDRRPCLKCALDISSDTGVRGPQNYFVIKKAFSCQTSGWSTTSPVAVALPSISAKQGAL